MNKTHKRYQLEHILKKLVAIPSVTSNLNSASEAVECVADILKPTNILQSRGKISGYPYLIASTRKPNEDTIWFVSHIDVVPAAESMFRVTSDEKNYYGRGVFDMKGMAAAMLAAFLKLPNPEQTNVGFLFTTDEEIGGKNGIGKLVDRNFKGAAAFVFDQGADWVLQQKMKGILWLEVTATGKAAHGARPWLGHNANSEIVEYLHTLQEWYNDSIPKDDTDNYYTTFNLGTLYGGEATNQVNDKAVATIDVRFVSDAEAFMVAKTAKALAKKFKGINVKELMREPCVVTDTDDKWYKKTEQLIKKLGIKVGPNGEPLGHGSTDGRFFAPYDIPVITTRSPGGGQHGDGEWASKQGLYDLERLCLELFKASSKVQAPNRGKTN